MEKTDVSAMKNKILEELNRYPFKPTWWLRGRHGQTIWGPLIRKRFTHFGAPSLRHERWDTPDNDFLDLLFLDSPENTPFVLLFHGMEGTPRSYYLSGFARHLQALGWGYGILFFRSCGFGMNRGPKLYHLGDTTDADYVIRRLREQYPERPLFAVGISLGGNVLAKWLGEQGETAQEYIQGASVISVPYDPVRTAPHFHRLLFGLYVRHFVHTLVPKALDLSRRYPGLLDEEKVRRARSFYDFDNAVTAPLYGFSDAEDYWARSVCTPHLPDIRVPTLLLTSTDDPFVLPEYVPRQVAEESPWLYPMFTDRGGHAGYAFGSTPWRLRYWYEEQSLRFFQALLHHGQ